jgi:signal transduction histidine kinase
VLAAPLVLRTRFPATAWAASAVSLIWVSVAIGSHTLFTGVYPVAGVLVYGLCLYAVGVRGKSWFVLCVAAVTVLGALVVDARTSAVAILAAIPLLMGAIVRARRSSRTALAQQARRLEGERALLTERQRIARELHDIVAHHMSVIAIQAEAGPRKVANPPPELVESFADIRASALSGLDELRRLHGVMRSSGADTAPQPGLAELDGLLDSARSGGVRVTSSVSGPARALPQGIDLSAYRILQEALSNAMRHAPGSTVLVELAYAPGALVIKVHNDAYAAQDGAGDGDAAGHGLIGMRERAGMLGGHLEAGPTEDGGFLVTAVLPDTGDREGGER